MKDYLQPVILTRAHLVELLAETKYFNALLRELKSIPYSYKLIDGNYLFSFISYQPEEVVSPIDFDSIQEEALWLRSKFKEAQKQENLN